MAGGLKVATTDELQVRLWWDRWPAANVAIRTGEPSGIVVVDIDPDHGGHDSLAQLQDRHGPLPECRTVRTGGGGAHLYFAHPGGTIRNDAGRRLGAGIDIRGDGGYVIAPPSRHRNGEHYALLAHGTVLPPLPELLHRELTARPEPTPSRSAPQPLRSPSRWAHRALEGELHRLDAAVQGTRNDTLNRVAFRLGQLVAAGCLNGAEVEHALVHHAMAVGLGEREALRTTHSGLAAGAKATPGGALPDQ